MMLATVPTCWRGMQRGAGCTSLPKVVCYQLSGQMERRSGRPASTERRTRTQLGSIHVHTVCTFRCRTSAAVPYFAFLRLLVSATVKRQRQLLCRSQRRGAGKPGIRPTLYVSPAYAALPPMC
jgi:hypothetical protein